MLKITHFYRTPRRGNSWQPIWFVINNGLSVVIKGLRQGELLAGYQVNDGVRDGTLIPVDSPCEFDLDPDLDNDRTVWMIGPRNDVRVFLASRLNPGNDIMRRILLWRGDLRTRHRKSRLAKKPSTKPRKQKKVK